MKVMKVRLNTIENIKKFVDIANTYQCEVLVKEGRYVVSGRSIMGIFSLNLLNDVEIEICENTNNDAYFLIEELNENNLLMH